MVKAGVDSVYRNAIVGHSQQGTDAHYIVPSEDDLLRAMDQFTSRSDLEIVSDTKALPLKVKVLHIIGNK